MAIPFVQSIDMNDFQILNFVVHSAGSAPTNASTLGGMMWWDSGTYDVKVYNDNDATWNSLVQGPASSTNNYIPQWSGTIGNKLSTGLSVATTVGTPGVDTALVTEQGIREAIASAVSGGVNYQGAYNVATNSPDLEAGTGVLTGYMYTATTAGDFFTDTLAIGDVLIAETDAPTTLAEWTIVAREWNETFLELGDTPANYTAQGGFMVMVNATPNALEFVDPSGYALSNFSNDLYTAAALTKTDDTNVTLTLGGSPTTALLQATSLTLGWTGQLAATKGGTGIGTYVVGDLLYASTTSALSRLAAVPAGSFLRSAGAATAPAWSTMTIPNTITQDSILVANAADTLVALQVTGGQAVRLNAGGTAWEAFTPSSGGTSPHAFLDSTVHNDTTTAAVSRGSIIVGKLASPTWDELVVGGATTFLYSDGTDVSWKDVDFADLGTTPTTLSGYGISDTMANFDTALNDGNFAYVGGAFHDGFSDFVGNEHIDHSGVSILTPANSGLAGGGDLTTSRTLTLDINNLSTETTIVVGDFVPFWDITATAASKKISYANLLVALNADLTFTSDTNYYLNGVTVNSISDVDFTMTGITDITGIDFSHTHDTIYPTAKIGYLTGSVGTATITHNFNLTIFTDVIVQVWRQSDNYQVGVQIVAATKDTVTITFGAAAINPTETSFRYMIIGLQE